MDCKNCLNLLLNVNLTSGYCPLYGKEVKDVENEVSCSSKSKF